MDLEFLKELESSIKEGQLRRLSSVQKARLGKVLPELGFTRVEIGKALSTASTSAPVILEARRRVREGSLCLGRALVALEENRSASEVKEAIADLKALASESLVALYRRLALEALARANGKEGR
jgi:hypothetical protein